MCQKSRHFYTTKFNTTPKYDNRLPLMDNTPRSLRFYQENSSSRVKINIMCVPSTPSKYHPLPYHYIDIYTMQGVTYKCLTILKLHTHVHYINKNNTMIQKCSLLICPVGPSFALDTACSSSLLALDQAVNSIRQGHCDAAIVGGCSLCLKPLTALQFLKLGMLSPEGTCKSFDASGTELLIYYVHITNSPELWLIRISNFYDQRVASFAVQYKIYSNKIWSEHFIQYI